MDESSFIKREGDIFNIVTRECTPLKAFLEKFNRFHTSMFFRCAPKAYSYNSKTNIYLSDMKINIYINILIVAFSLLILINPPLDIILHSLDKVSTRSNHNIHHDFSRECTIIYSCKAIRVSCSYCSVSRSLAVSIFWY